MVQPDATLCCVIVADDLSGAADTAAGFAAAGWPATVRWRAQAGRWLPAGHDSLVVGLDTDTRGRSVGDAAAISATVVAEARAAGVSVVYKKVDSTLRGHVGDQVRAAVRAWAPDAVAIFAPAFPAAGRTTVGGRQRVGDRVLDAAALDVLLSRPDFPVNRLDLRAIRGGDATRLLAAEVARGVRGITCDAETDEDLDEIARAGLALGRRVVWAGSAGLARSLAGRLAASDPAGARMVRPEPCSRGPVVIVAGSQQRASRRQVARLIDAGAVDVEVPIDAPRVGDPADLNAWTSRIDDALDQGRDVVVFPREAAGAPADERVSRRLADVLAPLASKVQATVLTGGETARRVLDAWRLTGLDVVDEIEPGVPRGWAVGTRRVPVVTKAGGFGDDGTLERARRRLRRAGADDTVASVTKDLT